MPDLHLVDGHADDSDLTLLKQLRADVPPPGDDALTAARLRLTAAMDVPPSATRTSTRARYARRAAVGVAAAVALGLGAYALTGQDPNPGAHAGLSRPAGPTSRAVTPSTHAATSPVRIVDAAQLLDLAAVRARTAGDPVLAPGTFATVSTRSYGASSLDDPPDAGAYEFSENRSEQWLPASAAGVGYEHDTDDLDVRYPTAQQRRYAAQAPGGLPTPSESWNVTVGSGPANEIQVFPAVSSQPREAPCTDCSTSPWDEPTRTALATLPTEPARLRSSLFAWAAALHAEATKAGKPTITDAVALDRIGAVLSTGTASAALRSALFEVAKTIDGVTLTGAMRNYAGVRGLGVGLVDPFHQQINLVFDATGEFLGRKTVALQPSAQWHLKAGTVVLWTAVTFGVARTPTLPAGARLPRGVTLPGGGKLPR